VSRPAKLTAASVRFRKMSREQQRDDLYLRQQCLQEMLSRHIADFPDDPNLDSLIEEVMETINTPITDAHPN